MKQLNVILRIQNLRTQIEDADLSAYPFPILIGMSDINPDGYWEDFNLISTDTTIHSFYD